MKIRKLTPGFHRGCHWVPAAGIGLEVLSIKRKNPEKCGKRCVVLVGRNPVAKGMDLVIMAPYC
jgi:hypothetical protein